MSFVVFFNDLRLVFKMDSLGREILRIALPAALALAADPVASLIDTAFIGHLGPVELAAVGVSIAIFNQASRVTIFPLVSITTSFVAEEDTLAKISNIDHDDQPCKIEEGKGNSAKSPEIKKEVKTSEDEVVILNVEKMERGDGAATKFASENHSISSQKDGDKSTAKMEASNSSGSQMSPKKKRHIPSASTAILIGTILGILQATLLIFAAKPLLVLMGVKSHSPILQPALKYLVIRSLGSPAVLLSLAMQGVFRGFKDTTTPLVATVVGDATNIILDPILIFVCRFGVSGAATAHVISQYLITLILLWRLVQQVNLLPPSIKDLQLKKFLKKGIWLLARVIAVTFCVTLAASRAARLGATTMAAFQIALQVWLTSSLLADGLAVAGQAIIASAYAENDYKKVVAAAARVLQMSLILGIGLSALVGFGLYFGSGIFSKDANVLRLITIAIPFVAATQPINSLAFVLDGVNFGASDFAYTAYSMIIVAVASILAVIFMSKSNGFIGIWIALTIYMVLRSVAGLLRIGTRTGPWKFLRN